MSKELATIQRIDNLKPIDGADRIELAQVMGWQIIVQKDEFKIGDNCIYMELDSLLPDKKEFEFMRRHKFRVRTIRMRGVVSQGLVFPLTILPTYELKRIVKMKDPVGHDVTGVLGIRKYEKPTSDNNNQSGGRKRYRKKDFPSYVPKTDEPLLQSHMKALDELRQHKCYVTKKYDGTSGTFFYKDGKLYTCSRNNIWDKSNRSILDIIIDFLNSMRRVGIVRKIKNRNNSYIEIAEQYNLKEKLKPYDGIVIQGEICGPSIQSNPLGLKEKQLFVFDVYDIKEQRYYSYNERSKLCVELNLPMVETVLIDNGSNFTLDSLVELASKQNMRTVKRQKAL